MRFTTKTEYGLVCLVYMARHGSADLVTIKEIGTQEHFSMSYIEKILQKLRASNIVAAHSGKQGGYTLARHPSRITVKEIVEALEGHTFAVFCEPQIRSHIVCTHFCMCGVRPLWAKTKQILDDFYGNITLEMITREEPEAKSAVLKTE